MNQNEIIDRSTLSSDILEKIDSGQPLSTILLKEHQVFPDLIPAQPTTARKSRYTGTLLGKPTPKYVKLGRSVFYRLSDVIEWLSDVETFKNTSHHSASLL